MQIKLDRRIEELVISKLGRSATKTAHTGSLSPKWHYDKPGRLV